MRAVQRLGAGIAQATHAVTIDDASGHRHRLVLQRWIRPGWQSDDPGFDPEKESAVLEALAGTGIPAPRLIAVDVDGSIAGDPALLVERLPGRPPTDREIQRPPILATLGETLAAIHAAGAPVGPLRGLAPPYWAFGELKEATIPPSSHRPDLWTAAMDEASSAAPPTSETLIHRDFHAGNTLWVGHSLTGVVDWTSASWGAPAADLAHLRVDLVRRVGSDEAELARSAFERAGGDLTGGRHHDLRTVFDYLTGGGTATLAGPALERFERFLALVLEMPG